MKFSAQWLHDWVPFDLGTVELCDKLTNAGLEVDGVEPVADDLADVVVATVEAVEKHPNADKLTVCQVYDGDARLTVVCGAPQRPCGHEERPGACWRGIARRSHDQTRRVARRRVLRDAVQRSGTRPR